MSNRQLGASWAGISDKGKGQFNPKPLSLTYKQRERRVEGMPSSPPVKNLSVDEKRGDRGTLPALLPYWNCADKNSLLKILMK